MQNETIVRMSRRRRRLRRKTPFLSRIRSLFIFLSGVALVALVGLVGLFAYSYTSLATEMPELDNYASQELAQTSVVYDINGDIVDELYGVQNRYVVDYDQISPTLPEAVVAIEDRRFYKHDGVDFEAIGRAATENLQSMSIQEGGSTITQQLIKNTYIAQEKRTIPSFERKFIEASLAWQYEDNHTKEEVLEQYLNTVYFGANAYGAEAAAKTYFSKSAEDLTLSESAMLAGIINLPGTYDPFTDPESARKRRDVVLDNMLQYGDITKKEHEEAVNSDLGVSRGRVEYKNDNEYFLNAVKKELAQEYGDDVVYEGGLKIQTTLDPTLQELANEAVGSIVTPEDGDPSASLVSVEPDTGAVRALVGGSDYEQVKFNLATQAQRQPGSTFKAFVLAEAINQGISPESLYKSESLKIPLPDGADEPFYKVDNYDNKERGPISIETATEESDNTVFVQLALDLGMKKVVEMAHDLGIETELDPYPATAIGGVRIGLTPLEMASAYSTFANSGVHMEPYLVEKVTTEKSGEEVVLESHRLKGNRALSRDEAAVATQTLRGVVEDGTASQFHDLDEELGRPSAGKTGTTERFRDAWYVGYVPQLATSVWVGYPKPKSMVNVNGLDEINGENYPLDIWSAYMREAVEEFPEQEFDKPSPDFELDKKTGGRAYKEAETTGASSSFQDFLDKLRSGGEEETETTSEPQPVEPQPVEPQPVEPTVAPPVETNPEVTVAPITTVTTAPTVTPERNPRRNQGSKRRKNRQSTPRREQQSNPRPNTQRNPANSNDGDLVEIPDF
jgi:penicillin-binding protein 1A